MLCRKSSAVHLARRLLFAMLALTVAVSATADTVSLSPSKDNTLFEDDQGHLSNGAGEWTFSGRTNMKTFYLRRSLLAFDVAGAVPAGSTITSAALTLRVSQNIANDHNFDLRRVLADWGEGASNSNVDGGGGGAVAEVDDATWFFRFYSGEPNLPSTDWATPGGDFSGTASATLSVGGTGDYTWGSNVQMVADVQAWLDTPANNFGWLVLGVETEAPTAKRFDTRESLTPSARPRLVIVYQPAGGAATATATRTATATGSQGPATTPTATVTGSQSPFPTATITPSPTPGQAETATPSATASPSATGSATPSPPVRALGTRPGGGWMGLVCILLAVLALRRARRREPA